MDRLAPVVAGQGDLPVLVADDHDTDGAPRDELFNHGRLGAAPPAGELFLVLAAVPVAPLGDAVVAEAANDGVAVAVATGHAVEATDTERAGERRQAQAAV